MGIFERLFPKSCSRVLHISSKSGLHLRPAASFAAEAKKYRCIITAESRGKSVDAKALNALLSLDLQEGDHFELTCKGSDAESAIEALTTHFEQLMGHEESKTTNQTKPSELSDIPYQSESLQGETLFGGIAIAPVIRLIIKTVHTNTVDFKEAVTHTLASLQHNYEADLNDPDRDIFLAQQSLLKTLGKEVGTIEALKEAIDREIEALKGTSHASKADDYLDILAQVRAQMGQERRLILPKTPFILITKALLPSDIALLSQSACQGVILQETSATSHVAILLRAAAIPSLIIDNDMIEEGKEIILDTLNAVVVPDPSIEDLALAKERLQAYTARQNIAHAKRHEAALTSTGTKITILANVSNLEDAKAAKEEGAEGIGLLRTEFLFGETKPSLEEQQEAYRAIFSLFEDVTVRTLDVGGDKSLPYLDLPKERNPFLGIRGIRLLQTHPELIAEQLLAIFLAAGEKPVKIMFPMIATPEEFSKAKAFAQKVAQKNDVDIAHHQFGMMIEVPSVLFGLKAFDTIVDFYSIGTNDLIQYLFAIERTHPTLKADSNSPLLYEALSQIAAHTTKPLSLCGELASDECAVEKLIEIGIKRLSLSAGNIPKIKETIRHV